MAICNMSRKTHGYALQMLTPADHLCTMNTISVS